MCSHYEAPSPERLLVGFGVAPDTPFTEDLWRLLFPPHENTYLEPF